MLAPRHMSTFRQLRRPLIIIAAVAVVDVAVRFGFGFQMGRVVLVEAMLFAVATLPLAWPAVRDKSLSRLELWLAAIFGLGSLRAGLWSAGLPVSIANLAVLAVGLLVILSYFTRRWLHRRRSNTTHHNLI